MKAKGRSSPSTMTCSADIWVNFSFSPRRLGLPNLIFSGEISSKSSHKLDLRIFTSKIWGHCWGKIAKLDQTQQLPQVPCVFSSQLRYTVLSSHKMHLSESLKKTLGLPETVLGWGPSYRRRPKVLGRWFNSWISVPMSLLFSQIPNLTTNLLQTKRTSNNL